MIDDIHISDVSSRNIVLKDIMDRMIEFSLGLLWPVGLLACLKQ